MNFDEIVEHEEPNSTDKAVEELLSKVTDLTLKVTNLANKLEEHMDEPDAHSPPMLATKRDKKKNK